MTRLESTKTINTQKIKVTKSRSTKARAKNLTALLMMTNEHLAMFDVELWSNYICKNTFSKIN